jgi:hypothetical protein
LPRNRVCGDPHDLDGPRKGPCFRGRVIPSFSQGFPGEHQIGGSRPRHLDQVAPFLMIGGSEWAVGIRQEGPGCRTRVSPRSRPKAFRADVSSIPFLSIRGPTCRGTILRPRSPGGEPGSLMPRHRGPIPYIVFLTEYLQGLPFTTRRWFLGGVEGHVREILRLFRKVLHRGAISSGNTYIISRFQGS